VPRFECSICFEEVEGGYSRRKGKRSGGVELKQRACFRPCNHAGACTECAVDIWDKTNKCPFCETKLSGKPAAIHFWPGTLADTPYDLILEWILCIKIQAHIRMHKGPLVNILGAGYGILRWTLSLTWLSVTSFEYNVSSWFCTEKPPTNWQLTSNSNQCTGIHIYSGIWIRFDSNWIELNLYSIQGCMQCHSIFPFKWNLILTKSIQFFHQLISWSSLVVCSSVELY
jgi:hypothetical protein